MSPGIYKQLLGDAWSSLAETIHLAHEAGIEHTGAFRVSHRDGFLARLIIVRSKLPRRSTTAPTRLRITVRNQTENWERWFGEDQFTTQQWASPKGLLVERFGAWELHFALQSDPPNLLRYVQKQARVHLGAFSFPVPMSFAPSVSAIETVESASRIRIRVEVKLPLIGHLIGYDGYLDVNGKTS